MTPSKLRLVKDERGLLLPVKVVPGASRTRLVGFLDGALKVAVAAPPEKGKANKALVKFFAEVLDIPWARISIEHGHSSARKTLLLAGVSQLELVQKLLAAI